MRELPRLQNITTMENRLGEAFYNGLEHCSTKDLNDILSITCCLWDVDINYDLFHGNPDHILTGSVGEGTATDLCKAFYRGLPFEDEDVLVVRGSITPEDIYITNVHDGFLYIYSNESSSGQFLNKKHVLDMKSIDEYVDDAEIRQMQIKFQGKAEENISGPALNHTWSGSNVNRSFDHVPALECKEYWPLPARNWITRQRTSGWPSKYLIKKTLNHGFHVVPVSHPLNKNSEIEWRFSFSLAEKSLMRSLTKWQRNCFMLAKLVCKKAFEGLSMYCSYHIKTTFLWLLEEYSSDYFTEDNVATMVLVLLDRLILGFAKQTLSSYFIDKYNLLDALSPGHIKSCLHILRTVRRKPLLYLMAIYADHFVLRGRGTIFEILKTPALPHRFMDRTTLLSRLLHGNGCDLQKRIKCYQSVILPLTYRPIINIVCKLTELNYESFGFGLKFECPAILLEDINICPEEYQHDLQMTRSSVYCAIGSHFRVRYLNSEGEEKRRLLVKTHKVFKKSVTDVLEAYDSIYAEYAAFLIDTGELDKAKRAIGLASTYENEIYNHYFNGHGHYRVMTKYFLIWLRMGLEEDKQEELLGLYEKMLRNEGIDINKEKSCEMRDSEKMKDFINLIEQKGKVQQPHLLPRIVAIKKLIIGHYQENARLIFWVLKKQSP